MDVDLLVQVTERIRKLANSQRATMSWLEATFHVVDQLSDQDAEVILKQLIAQRYLPIYDADLLQLAAQKLNVAVQWSHMPLVPGGEWAEGRGQ